MKFFKNKHVILAMFISPILAIIAYFGVDYAVSERPHAAQKGQTYKLAASSNCRYKSGICTLQNSDIEVQLRAKRIVDNQIELTLDTEMLIQKVLVSITQNNEEIPPTSMQTNDPQGGHWQAKLELDNPEQSTLRLALSIADTLYFAETSTLFIDYETSFSQDNFAR